MTETRAGGGLPAPALSREVSDDVALLGDPQVPGGVTFAFTERSGGVSRPPYGSLNLGDRVGDDASAVAENRRRVLRAIGAEAFSANLVCPNQVHGDRVVAVASSAPEAVARAQAQAAEGADAVVCSAPGVPVLLVYADCVPAVLVTDGGFAVVHSGWKGTYARIAAKALNQLCAITGNDVSDVDCYLGPHIAGRDYEVSDELIERFTMEFGSCVQAGEGRLSLASAIEATLVSSGVRPWRILNADLSTATDTGRFFSYRKEGPVCGRHGAIGFMAPARP